MNLVEKMTTRIRSWCSRNLSYQGRLVLVNSVLMSIHIYWAQVFISPKKVLKEVEMMCRAFLWIGKHYSGKGGYVAWPNVCIPKHDGGLAIRKSKRGICIAAIGR